MALFGYKDETVKKFDGKTLAESIAYLSDISNIDTEDYNKLKAELYAHAIATENQQLFCFLESRYSGLQVADKEIIIEFRTIYENNPEHTSASGNNT